MIKRTLIIAMMIVLGLVFTSAVYAASPPEQEEGQEYVIQTDDWLSRLAKKYLGDGNLWPQIVEATNAQAAIDSRVSVISNPNNRSWSNYLYPPRKSNRGY